MLNITKILIIALLFLFSSCSQINLTSKGHKRNLQQGYSLSLENIEKIRMGMSKSQIKKILGSPTIIDPFHKKRWDYINQSRINNKIVKFKLTLFFNDNNQIEHSEYKGDLTPSNFKKSPK